MINYNNSVIYKICCKDINIKEIYVGSTANNLRIRKGQHKIDCNNINRNNYNSYVYQFIRQNGGFQNFDMVLIEKYSCNDRQELHKRERFYIELLEASLNSHIPNRGHKERYENNKEQILEKRKEYYESNKDKLLEQQKEYYEENKEKKKEYYEENKDKFLEQNKEYYELNKEKIKQHYESNKDKILEKQREKKKEKVECEICNKILSRGSLLQHNKNIHNI